MPRAKKQHLKKRPDGRYVCRYKDVFFYGWTEDEALAARDEYKHEVTTRSTQPITVQEYADKWLSLYKASVSTRCRNDYRKQLDKLVSICGHKPIEEVLPDDAAEVWTMFVGKSASLVKRARMIYVSLFDAAVENDLCRKNPFRSKSATPPKAQAGSHRALTPEEIQLIHATPHRMRTAVMVMLYAGLRRGEVMALETKDVDLSAGVIHVNKAVRYESNQPILSTPKTSAGVRDVPILKPLSEALKAHSGRVCVSAAGTTMSEIAWKRAWDSYILALSTAAGHEIDIRPHDLRHTYCTMLRDAGVDLKTAMKWLGHADEKMILRIYDHAGDARAAAAINQVEAMIRSQNGSQT